MKIKTLTFKATFPIAAVLLFSGWQLVQAQPNPDSPQRPRPPGGERQRGDRSQQQGFQPGNQPGAGLPQMERVLTPEQRESMRGVMESEREKMRGIQEKIRDARKALMKASLAEKFDEEAVRAKALEVAKLEAEVTVIRARAISKVQPPLSPEQIEQIVNPPPMQRMEPGAGGPRPNDRQGNRPPRGPRDENDLPAPPKPGAQ